MTESTHRRRRSVLAGATALACALALAPASSAANQPDPHAQTSIAWGACPALAPGATRDARQTCGTVTVPLDYRHPRGTTITVEVSRIATTKPGHRRGNLLLNPGGPALEGLDMPGQMATTLPSSVLDQYDLIGFDPRGVGHSSPVSCGLADGSENTVFPYPAADGSIDANVAAARAAAAQCATIGDELQYFTTANTARDLDRVRQALAVPKISYWGQSYGTYLGAVYTTLFPQRTDRVVLEGAVDPAKAWQQQLHGWDQGMDERFPDAAEVAAAAHADLGLGATVEQVTATYLALAEHLDRTPAAVPETPVSLSGAVLRAVTYQLLLHNTTLTPLTEFWKAARDLAAGKTPSAADLAVLRQILADVPDEPGVPSDNQVTAGLALFCGDAAWSRDVGSYAKATAAARAAHPLSAGMPDNIWPCAFWSHPPIEPRVRVTSHGPRNVLVLQNRRDNATPWEGALGMRAALGTRAGFVGADNGGHYVYGTGSPCADRATNEFLAYGTLPRNDLYCPGPRH